MPIGFGIQSIAGHGFAAAWRTADGQIGRRISLRWGAGGFFFCLSPVLRPFLWVLVVVAFMLATPLVAFASGEERTTVGDDLLIGTDTRWAGGAVGGYLPVRVEISNQDRARSAGARSHSLRPAHGATVRRVVGVGKRATVRFTLSIPLAAFRQGVLRVYDQRGELSSHVRVIGAAASLASRWRLPCSWSRPGRWIARITSRRPAARSDVNRFGELPQRTRPHLRKWSRQTACLIRGLILADSI